MNRLLPIVDSKYQRLEYLESTGTQYIDTGVIGNSDTGLYVDVQYLNDNDTVCIGSRADSGDTRLMLGMAPTGFYLAWNIIGNRPTKNLDRNVLMMNFLNDKKAYINTTLVNEISTNLATQNVNICLFACGYSPTPYLNSSVKIYNAKITDGSTLVRNFVPVLRKSDNELGMLDLVEGKFYPNAGTGKFSANLDTMYPIIQGTPTQSPYGVFTDFTSDNNLLVPTVINMDNDYEFKFCFIANGVNLSLFTKIGTWNYNGIIISNTYKVRFDVRNATTDEHITMDSSTTITLGQKYFVIVNKTGLHITMKLSTDDKNWTVDEWDLPEGYVTANNSSNHYIGIGSAGAFNGVIDLNRSYIKIGSTKYKLQAVVGYTVVGSPTISDGVVSGFSSSDYLEIKNNLITNKFELVTRLIKGTSNPTGQANLFLFNGYGFDLIAFANGDVRVQIKDIDNNYRIVGIGTIDDTSYVKAVVNPDNVIIYKSSDGINYTLTATINYSIISLENANLNIGRTNNYAGFGVDLKATYIKINNKLWFNGLEA